MVKQLNLRYDDKEHRKLAKFKRETGLTWEQFFLWLAEMKKNG